MRDWIVFYFVMLFLCMALHAFESNKKHNEVMQQLECLSSELSRR